MEHWKKVIDSFKGQGDPARKTNRMGGLVQADFLHYVLPPIPRNLEFAGRYAFVDPIVSFINDLQEEYSGVMTFFNGHMNKVNFQVSLPDTLICTTVKCAGFAAVRPEYFSIKRAVVTALRM